MDVLTSETCWALNNEIIKQVTSSWSLFIQLSILLFLPIFSGLDFLLSDTNFLSMACSWTSPIYTLVEARNTKFHTFAEEEEEEDVKVQFRIYIWIFSLSDGTQIWRQTTTAVVSTLHVTARANCVSWDHQCLIYPLNSYWFTKYEQSVGLVPWPQSVTQLNWLGNVAAGAVGTHSDCYRYSKVLVLCPQSCTAIYTDTH